MGAFDAAAAFRAWERLECGQEVAYIGSDELLSSAPWLAGRLEVKRKPGAESPCLWVGPLGGGARPAICLCADLFAEVAPSRPPAPIPPPICCQAFGKPSRICALDAGHEGEHAGPVSAAILSAARRARKAAHAELEARQREATASAAGGADLDAEGRRCFSPADFAAAILAALPASPAQLAARLAGPGGLIVNRAPAGAREAYQALCRLRRDGLADGDWNDRQHGEWRRL